MKVMINESQKGLLFQNGVLLKILGAGKYYAFGGKTIEVLPVGNEIAPLGCPLSRLLECTGARGLTTEVTVKNGEICLHYVDGCFEGALTAGRHAFWSEQGEHEFKVYSTDEPKITDVATTVLGGLGAAYVTEINVPAQCKAVVGYNGKTSEYLNEGLCSY